MTTPYDNFSFSTPTVDSDEGIARVNLNAGQTGAFAYKDSQGKTVLTNVAIDATGKESKIGSIGDVPTVPVQGVAAQNPAPTYANTPDVRSSLFAGLDKLRTATNPAEAAALYDSLVQSLTGEMTRMEADAQNLAQSKYGVPFLQKELEAGRAADRMSPSYMPGMGDSPITQKIVVEMRQAGEAARAEKEQFLRTNISWNSLDTIKRQADRELQRIQKITDQQSQVALTRATATEEFKVRSEFSQQQRVEDEARKRKEELVAGYNTLNGDQIRNVSILSADELGGLQEGSEEKRIRIAELAFKNKDKNFIAAISATQPDEKLSLALQGNTYATKLVALEESTRLGLPIEETNKMLRDMKTRFASFDARKAINTMALPQEERAKRISELNEAMYDMSKRPQTEKTRATLFMQQQQQILQTTFDNDVSTWRVQDPYLQTMLTESVKKSQTIAGKSDVKNVMAAWLDDGPDDQRLMRANQFINAMRGAAERFNGSAFGQPDWIKTKAAIEREGISNGWWMRAVRAIQKADNAVPRSNLFGEVSPGTAMAFHPGLPAGNLLGMAANAVAPSFQSQPLKLDPDAYQPLTPEQQVKR